MNAKGQMVKTQPEVIFFDAAGTLIHLKQSVGWHYAKVTENHGVAVEAEAVDMAFSHLWKAQYVRDPSSTARPEDDRPWWKYLAVEVLKMAAPLQHQFVDKEAWFEELYEHFAQPGVWGLFADARPCLEKIRGRYRLSVLSNFDGRLRRILQDLEVAEFFEELFISSELGCEKPHPQIFQQAAEQMGVACENCLHVGDDQDRDWAGAKNAGMAAFRMKRPENGLAALRQILT